MNDLGADDLLRMLARRSLVQVDPRSDTVTVHDLLFGYARTSLPAGRLEELHWLLAHNFVDRWGGLDEGLPRLRDPDKLDAADRYGVATLIVHLLAASRPDVTNTVLAMEWPTTRGRADNTWHTVHEDLGQTSTYLAAVRAA
jgi:hypothetical protein